jgi:hypothetical protein
LPTMTESSGAGVPYTDACVVCQIK